MSRPFTRSLPLGLHREHDDKPLVARHADRGVGKPPKDHGPGRVCAEDGCETVMSRFNPNPRCYVHDDTPFREWGPRNAA